MSKVIKINLLLLVVGSAYLIWLRITGMGIPCLFHMLTGLYCPGCGMTRALLAISRFDLIGAFRAHWAFVICLPFMFYLYVMICWRYGQKEKIIIYSWENTMMILMIVIWAVRATMLNFWHIG